VPFTRDGETEVLPQELKMQDVTLSTCIKWAYGVQQSQINGPDWLESDHFDITAKTDAPATLAQMKQMMQAMLAERFQLKFHREQKEMKGYALVLMKTADKLHPAVGEGPASFRNSAIGFVAKSASMPEFATYVADPLGEPVVDKTGLKGKYDFSVDFTSYLPEDQSVRPNVISVMMLALKGELGIQLQPQKITTESFVVDHAEQPSAN
jgi:uncharacterized protein (TIGR03435 family)